MNFTHNTFLSLLDREKDGQVMSVQNISKPNAGWRVTLAATGINLALGILYSWSIIAKFLKKEMGWSAMDSQLPYMIACGVFALLMVPGGRIQDRIGPRLVIMASAVFAALGMIGSNFFLSVAGLSVFFGIFFGTAMGLGYSSTTPPAVKWFGAHRRGLVTGLVVSGFGLASVYAAPLTDYLLKHYGLQGAFLTLGIAFFVVIMALAQLMKNPPAGFVPAPAKGNAPKKKAAAREDYEWHAMLRMPQFYFLWCMLCFGALAGLMVIGQLSSIASEQAGLSLGFLLVAMLAVFNAGGRIAGGVLFDRIGRTRTLLIIFSLQAVNFLLFSTYSSLPTMLLGTMVAGFCYGACLSVFPATTASLFGVKNLGVNYGLVFTAWGAGGVFGGLIGGRVRDLTGTYLYAFLIAAALCLVGAGLTFLIKQPHEGHEASPAARSEA